MLNKIFLSLLLFLLAGICEIGGGYLVWLWIREGMGLIYGAVGGFVLFLYGIIPTFQSTHFHRVYGAYGGIFIVMALFWGWIFDGIAPDSFDLLGGIIAIFGVVRIFYAPRKGERAIWSR